jgi:hypothetical protein
MDPVVVVNIYVNRDGTADVSGAPQASVAQGTAGTQPGIEIPPPPSAAPTDMSAAGQDIPPPPTAPSDEWVTPPPAPSEPSGPTGYEIPPPPVLDAEPSGTVGSIPPPPEG